MNKSLIRVIALMGGPSAAAEQIGITPQAIHLWKKKGYVPAKQVIPVVLAINGQVTPHDLRPDLYPDPDWLPTDVREKNEVA